MRIHAETTSLRQPFVNACLGLILFAGLVPSRGSAQQSSPNRNVYVVTHVDLAANGERLAAATKVLREFAAESKQDQGNVRFELLVQDGRLNHFTIVEVWQTREAFEAHSSADHTKSFREKLQPVMGSPFDERLHALLP
jgi:quinol monooxygenase YgiN